MPFLFLEISGGQIGNRSESRSRCRCQTLTRRRSEQEHQQQYIHNRANERSKRQREDSGAHGASESQYRGTEERETAEETEAAAGGMRGQQGLSLIHI